MKAVLTLQIDEELAALLDQACADSGRTRSETVCDALRRHLQIASFERLREKAMPFAKERGIVTDEDVFRVIS